MKTILRILTLSVLVISSGQVVARSGRGEHKTEIKCNVDSFVEAQDCMIELGKEMPTENDPNAVFVTTGKEAKSLLSELLVFMNSEKDLKLVEEADYLAAVVQNDDESYLYYYVFNDGEDVTPQLVGYTMFVGDMADNVCEYDSMDEKFLQVQNLLLGEDAGSSVLGTVWFEDGECD